MKRRAILKGLVTTPMAIAGITLAPNARECVADDRPKGSAKSIPLNLIYSTSRQEGLKLIDQGRGDNEFRNEMRELHQQATKVGASNVFLARGDDIDAVVRATWEVFVHGQGVDGPAGRDWRYKSDRYWFVAYQGIAGSDPPAWELKAVAVAGENIRLQIKRASSKTADEHPYFYWAPIGKLKAGTYTLEVIEPSQKLASLVRTVKIADV